MILSKNGQVEIIRKPQLSQAAKVNIERREEVEENFLSNIFPVPM
jgi:hypothetical protein